MALLRDAEEQRVSQLEQQTDSIRYLNELNTVSQIMWKSKRGANMSTVARILRQARDVPNRGCRRRRPAALQRPWSRLRAAGR